MDRDSGQQDLGGIMMKGPRARVWARARAL